MATSIRTLADTLALLAQPANGRLVWVVAVQTHVLSDRPGGLQCVHIGFSTRPLTTDDPVALVGGGLYRRWSLS